MQNHEFARNIIMYIKEGNRTLAHKAVRDWNDTPVIGALPDETMERKYEFVVVLTFLMEALRECGYDRGVIEQEYARNLRELHAVSSREELFDYTEKTVDRFGIYFEKISYDRYSQMIRKIMIAVDQDLTPKLTLRYFARKLNVNHTYLSDLFRKETGVTLTEYVTEKRMKRAEELLKTTSVSVKSVAKQVGIEDVQYFGKLFKKRAGVTPTQFRQFNK